MGALHVVTSRGFKAANAARLGGSNPSMGAAVRVADLSAADLRAFCDCATWDGGLPAGDLDAPADEAAASPDGSSDADGAD